MLGSALAGPDLRQRALVSAYRQVAGAVADPQLLRAFEVLASGAPALLYDTSIQKAYWYASLPVKSREDPQAPKVLKARAALAKHGFQAQLEDRQLRSAFRYFFHRGRMRQRLEPLLADARPHLEAITEAGRARACRDLRRLADVGRWLYEFDRYAPPGASAREAVAALRTAGYLPAESADCPEDPATWSFDPRAGFVSPLAGAGTAPRPPPASPRNALAAPAARNPFLAALLEEIPPDPSGEDPGALVKQGLDALAGQDLARGEAALSAVERTLRPARGARVARMSLLFLIAEARQRRDQLEPAREAAAQVLALARELEMAEPAAAAAALAGKIERTAGDWDTAEKLLAQALAGAEKLYGEGDARVSPVLLEQACLLKLRGEHDQARALLVKIQGGLEDAGAQDRLAAHALALGRAEVAARELPAAEARLTRAVDFFSARPEAPYQMRLAAGRYLRGLARELGRRRDEANLDYAEASKVLLAAPVTPGLLVGLEPEVLAGFGSLLRIQKEYLKALAYLDLAEQAARLEGGPNHPLLPKLAKERQRLAEEREATAQARNPAVARIQRTNELLRAGKNAEAAAEAEAGRKEMATSGKHDASLLGWLRFFEFKALYQAKEFPEAYALLSLKEPAPFEMQAKNSGFMASVATELAVRLKRPAQEVLDWGERCYTTRLADGDEESALHCARNVCTLLELRDEEPQAGRFAERLIELGSKQKNPELVMEGFEVLAMGRYREGRTRELAALMPRLDGLLAAMPLSQPQVERRQKLLDVLSGKFRLGSNKEKLDAFLKS